MIYRTIIHAKYSLQEDCFCLRNAILLWIGTCQQVITSFVRTILSGTLYNFISKEIVMNLEMILLETIYFWLRLEKSPRNAEHVPSLLTASVTKKWKIISSGSNPYYPDKALIVPLFEKFNSNSVLNKSNLYISMFTFPVSIWPHVWFSVENCNSIPFSWAHRVLLSNQNNFCNTFIICIIDTDEHNYLRKLCFLFIKRVGRMRLISNPEFRFFLLKNVYFNVLINKNI